MPDRSNGYETIADEFMSGRSNIGAALVSEWAKSLPHGAFILDIGCGHGVPISQGLARDGFAVHGIDASPTLLSAFRKRFPDLPAECGAVEESEFFNREFDGVVAWGLIFLLTPGIQRIVIAKVSRALKPHGQFLFTAPRRACSWIDMLTGHESISLGSAVYQEILTAEALNLAGIQRDEGDNDCYLAVKVPQK